MEHLCEVKQLGRTFDSREIWQMADGLILEAVHAGADCQKPCAFHGPSDHHMVTWPLLWGYLATRTGACLIRECPHGWHHPDPDGYFWPQNVEHLCDGCCDPEREQVRVV